MYHHIITITYIKTIFNILRPLTILFFTVWKLRKFSLKLFWQKFRESNVFTKEITKELIWRNIFGESIH